MPTYLLEEVTRDLLEIKKGSLDIKTAFCFFSYLTTVT